jgi:hypothetical protein
VVEAEVDFFELELKQVAPVSLNWGSRCLAKSQKLSIPLMQ